MTAGAGDPSAIDDSEPSPPWPDLRQSPPPPGARRYTSAAEPESQPWASAPWPSESLARPHVPSAEYARWPESSAESATQKVTPAWASEPPAEAPVQVPVQAPAEAPAEAVIRSLASTRSPEPPDAPASRPVKRTWWLVPFFGGALVVIAAAAVLSQTVFRHHPGTPRSTTSSATIQAAPMPAMMFPDGLFRQLSQDMQTGNRAAFLSMVAPSARPAVTIWWDNLQALGFTTGVILPTASHDTVHLDGHGNGTAIVLAGAHNPLDPLDGKGKSDIPCERYRIGLHFANPTATGQISSWQPLDDDPWDQGARLYVHKSTHVVVAGPPGDSALVDETVPLAEDAATYDVGLMNHVNFRDLRQQGFIVFVSGDATVRNRWLATTPQPKGWPAELLGARVSQLPGPGASADYASVTGNVSTGNTGGARVVITPYEQDGGTPHGETVTLVRDFMLDILAAHDEDLVEGLPLDPVPSWAEQGMAVAVQGLFEANNNPAPATYRFTPLSTAIHSLPASYKRGQLPNSHQLYGPSVAADENWNDVAASVYEYIELKYGMNQMLASAMLLYTRYSTPFGNVLKSSHGNSYTFYTQGAVETGWRAWLAHG